MNDLLLYLVIFVLLSGCHCLLIRRIRTQEQIDAFRCEKSIHLQFHFVLYLILMIFTVLELLAGLKWQLFVCLGLGSFCLAVLVLAKVYYYRYSGVALHGEDMAVYGLQRKTIAYSAVHSIVIIRRSYGMSGVINMMLHIRTDNSTSKGTGNMMSVSFVRTSVNAAIRSFLRAMS